MSLHSFGDDEDELVRRDTNSLFERDLFENLDMQFADEE